MSLTIKDLLVPDGIPNVTADRWTEGHHRRPATVADLVEVAESMGGEVVESLGVVFDDVPEGKDGLLLAVGSRAWSNPGRYLVIPLEETQK